MSTVILNLVSLIHRLVSTYTLYFVVVAVTANLAVLFLTFTTPNYKTCFVPNWSGCLVIAMVIYLFPNFFLVDSVFANLFLSKMTETYFLNVRGRNIVGIFLINDNT